MAALPANVAIVRSAIELGHQLGLVTLAEGVEDDATWLRLRELGCDGGQGYAFARPMPFREIGCWLREKAPEAVPGARRAHAARCLAFVENAGGRAAERTAERLRELHREKHSLYLALDDSIERGDAETALRLGTALRFFWVDRGLVDEGSDALRRALALPRAQGATPIRAAALNALGILLGQHEDYTEARALLAESSTIYRRLGDRKTLAASLSNLALVLERLGELDAARDAYLESLALRRSAGDLHGEAIALNNLGAHAYRRGELTTSRSYARRAFEMYRSTGDDHGMAAALETLGAVGLEMGDYAESSRCYRSSLTLFRDLGMKEEATQPMAGLAMIAAETGAPERARIIVGAVAALRDRYPGRGPIDAERYERCIAELDRTVDSAARAKALVEGRALSWDEAIALALVVDSGAESPAAPGE